MGWLKNTRGKPDAALTVAVAAAFVVLFRVLVGGIHLAFTFRGQPVDLSFAPIEAALASTVLGVLWTVYWARKHTDAGGFGAKTPPRDDSPPSDKS